MSTIQKVVFGYQDLLTILFMEKHVYNLQVKFPLECQYLIIVQINEREEMSLC